LEDIVSRRDLSGAELRAWAARVLAGHGLATGEGGDDLAALGALAESHGWGHATEEYARRRRERRWRATVYRREAPGAQPWVTGGATGNAPTETGALSIALARMLARPVRETETVGAPDEF
jgi:hypothetical protein